MLAQVVAGGRDGARNLARHGVTRGFVAIPFRQVRQRREGYGLAEVETRQGGVDQVIGRHHNLSRKLVNRLAGDIPELRSGGARQDRLHADALVGELVNERMREREHEGLRGAVDAVQAFRRDRDDRRNIDDRAGAAGDKARDHRIRQPCQRGDVETDHVLHLVDVGSQQRCGGANTSVVDEQGDFGVGLQDVLHAPEVGRGREVGFDRLHLSAGVVDDPARQRSEPLAVPRHKNEVIAALREAIGVDRADPGRGAGDEGGALRSDRVHVGLRGSDVWVAVPEIDPSENSGYLAKLRCILPKNGNIHGSLRGHVDRALGSRGRQSLGCGAATEKAARDREPESVRARSAPADQIVQSLEPRARADGRRSLLHCRRKTDSRRCGRGRACRLRRVHDAARGTHCVDARRAGPFASTAGPGGVPGDVSGG